MKNSGRYRIWTSPSHSAIILAMLIAVVSCGMSPSLCQAQLPIEFEPIANADMINSPNPVQALDVVYDDVDPERQAFHIFLPDTKNTFPLVIYFHGGGFINGDRDRVFEQPSLQDSLKYFLENDIAFASVGYRLIETGQPDDQGVVKCLGDSKRALQFIRHHFNDLKINPDRVALMGGSAGAGTALWLSTRDEMAIPDSEDPVLRESTRVSAVHIGGSQATYDLVKWETVVYSDFAFTIEDGIEMLGFERFSNFYGGVDSIEQIYTDPTLIQYREDVDMLFHLSSDDPPIYIRSGSGATVPEEDLFHHGAHSITIQNQAMAASVSEVKARINFMNIDTTEGECPDSFLARHLGVELELKGDVNNDGSVNLLDVAPFVDVLTGVQPFDSKADVNCDGRVNLLDVHNFVLLLGG